MDQPTGDGRLIGALLRIPREAATRQILIKLDASGFGDVRLAHFTVFAHLPPEGLRLTELAEAALLTKQSMGYLVDELEARGYVERAPDPADRRAKLVRMTERGRAVEQVVRRAILQVEAEWAAYMAPGEFAELSRLLRSLIAHLEAHDAAPPAPAPHTA
jgi:DNA-binding MarR family transcriptional regulator